MRSFHYHLFLQQLPGTASDEGDPLTSYHHAVAESLRIAASAAVQTHAEIIQKNGSILRGGLTHFLSTPLKSDKDEIIRLIEESIAASVRQLDAAPQIESAEHALWHVMEPASVPLHRQMVGVMKRLLKNGRSQLAAAGCLFGKNAGEVTASFFSFDGFATVRTIRGIVDGACGSDPLRIASGTMFSSIGGGEGSFTEPHRVVLEFDDAEGRSQAGVMERCGQLGEMFGIRSWSLMRRVQHASGNGEYQLHFGIDAGRTPLGSVLLALIGDDSAFEDAVTSTGAVTVMERIAV